VILVNMQGPLMNYHGLHDRSLKHYFSTSFDPKRPRSVERGAHARIVITQLKENSPKSNMRKSVRIHRESCYFSDYLIIIIDQVYSILFIYKCWIDSNLHLEEGITVSLIPTKSTAN